MTTTVQPTKGMKFAHSRRKAWDGSPLECTVTVVRQGMVHWRHRDGRGKTRLADFDKFCAEVLELPTPIKKSAGPALTDAECIDLHNRAHEAGRAAGEAAVPVPMHVVQRANPFDDNSPVVKDWGLHSEGVCGFAAVRYPGTSKFARWAKKNGVASKAYEGGFSMWVRGFGQSMERKEAYARAYAETLKEAGMDRVYVWSRMD